MDTGVPAQAFLNIFRSDLQNEYNSRIQGGKILDGATAGFETTTSQLSEQSLNLLHANYNSIADKERIYSVDGDDQIDGNEQEI